MPNRLVHIESPDSSPTVQPETVQPETVQPENSAYDWGCSGGFDRSCGSTDFLRSEVVDCLSLAFGAIPRKP